MRRKILVFLGILAFGGMGGGSWLLWGEGGVLSPGPHGQDMTVVIEKGNGLPVIAQTLAATGIVAHPWPFMAAVILSGNKGLLKAGEYLVPAHASPVDIAHILASGKVVIHQVTIPEGLTVAQVMEIVKTLPYLKGEMPPLPAEGSLLPETYGYVYGDTREKLVSYMRQGMEQALEDVWEKRKPGFLLKTPGELLILASIVEKETGVSVERPRVASVFLNRLKKGMKLQSDPTAIYGLTLGRGSLGRAPASQDMKHISDYNTYVISGLPPTPIACPGRKALQAVINPEDTEEYYFVADGTGGHAFSTSYNRHIQRVKEWRKIRKKDKK